MRRNPNKSPSLVTRLKELVRVEYPEWVHGGMIERLSLELGYSAENGRRRARELSDPRNANRTFEKNYKNGKVIYRWNK